MLSRRSVPGCRGTRNVEVAHELIRLWREEDDFGGLPDMDAARSDAPTRRAR